MITPDEQKAIQHVINNPDRVDKNTGMIRIRIPVPPPYALGDPRNISVLVKEVIVDIELLVRAITQYYDAMHSLENELKDIMSGTRDPLAAIDYILRDYFDGSIIKSTRR